MTIDQISLILSSLRGEDALINPKPVRQKPIDGKKCNHLGSERRLKIKTIQVKGGKGRNISLIKRESFKIGRKKER